MKDKSDPRETEGFFLNVPEKLEDPFPDLAYFRENRPVFYHEGLGQSATARMAASAPCSRWRISLETLFRRMPNLRRNETREIRWYRNAASRGPDSLPLIF